jgi:hypothetical protein
VTIDCECKTATEVECDVSGLCATDAADCDACTVADEFFDLIDQQQCDCVNDIYTCGELTTAEDAFGCTSEFPFWVSCVGAHVWDGCPDRCSTELPENCGDFQAFYGKPFTMVKANYWLYIDDRYPTRVSHVFLSVIQQMPTRTAVPSVVVSSIALWSALAVVRLLMPRRQPRMD